MTEKPTPVETPVEPSAPEFTDVVEAKMAQNDSLFAEIEAIENFYNDFMFIDTVGIVYKKIDSLLPSNIENEEIVDFSFTNTVAFYIDAMGKLYSNHEDSLN